MTEESDISIKILEMVENTHPESVEVLIKEAMLELGSPEEEVLQHVIELHNVGRLKLHVTVKTVPQDFFAYLFSYHSLWFWVMLFLCLGTTVSVFTISNWGYPYDLVRYGLGSVFVLFLPGFSLMKTLFPTREIDNIERTALSIGISIGIVPIVGLLLNYTPWGIRLIPIMVSLLVFTLLLTVTGVFREYSEKTRGQSL